MKRAILPLFLAACAIGRVCAGDWPQLTGNAPECAEAFAIAQAHFKSKQFYLYALPDIPPEVKSSLVVKPRQLNLQEGDPLDIDEKRFEMPNEGGALGSSLEVYWQKEPQFGRRLVVAGDRVGWRGAMYSAYAIDEKMSPELFVQGFESDEWRKGSPPMVWQTWRPPLVFAARDPATTWLIDVGQPFEFLGPWRVFRNEPSGFKHVCTVDFRPKAKNPTDLLPPPVRKLEALLDSTMGSGKDEGTMQPTAQLRVDVSHTWANVALRPWAIGAPYNTREQVDAGLKKWARLGPKAREIHAEIQRTYPLAEQALATYYRDSLHMPPEEAKSAAAKSIDVAYRSHYTFP